MTATQRSWLDRLVVPIETPIKHHFFGCQMCGQCVLSHTKLICPMTCPKGLRNGPCGGTLEGHCEVYPDRPCVWVRVYERRGENAPVKPVQPPVNRQLVGTSSYLNFLTGSDRTTRLPLPPHNRVTTQRPTSVTGSRLEQCLKAGNFALTAEIQSPRTEQGLARVEREAQALAPLVDGLNATSQAGGMASVDSLTTSRLIRDCGGDPITQICGRDVTPAQFGEQLAQVAELGVRNIFCLTGDWYQNRSGEEAAQNPWNHFFPMESSQMLYEAYSARESGVGAVTGRDYGNATPRLFLGGAINPCSAPSSTVFARLAQKVESGLDFVQTQMILDLPQFQSWVAQLQQTGLANRFSLLASVPVILSERALEVCATLPGVRMPAEVKAALLADADGSGRIDAAGMRWAENTCRLLQATPGVAGIHLMLLGGQWQNLAGWVSDLRASLAAHAQAAQ